jgi:hypothetical protein
MATTTNYGWETPDDTDYVYQGAAAARTTANAIDTTLYSLARGVQSYVIDTTTSLAITTTSVTSMFTAPSFTPIAGRLYEITYSVGNLLKTTAAGQVLVRLYKGTTTQIDYGYCDAVALNESFYFSKTMVLTSTQMGTSAFIPTVRIQTTTNGVYADNTSTGGNGAIIIKDIGAA